MSYKGKFIIKSARDIYHSCYPAPAFLVPGFVPARGFTMLAGPYKGGKSWFVLWMCLMLSRGGVFLGSIALDVHKGLYLALEDSDSRLHYRMHCIGCEPSDNFQISTTFPSGNKGLITLRQLVQEDRSLEYVVIDTLGRFSNGRGKGGYQEDYDWAASIKNIADEFGIAIFIVTHTRKLIDERDEFNEITGSCGIMAAADSILMLKKSRNSSEGTLSSSGRDFEGKKYDVFFSKDSFCWTIKGENSDQACTPERQQILEVLQQNSEMTPQLIAGYVNQTPKAVSNILAKMRNEGIVEKGSKYGTWIAVSHPDPEKIITPSSSSTSITSSSSDEDLDMDDRGQFARI